MRDTLHSIVTKINNTLYQNRNKDYDRAKDFYVENKSDEELTHLAVYLIQYSKYLEGRRRGDTNKKRKEKLLRDIDNLAQLFYQYPYLVTNQLRVEKMEKSLTYIGKIRGQFNQYGLMEEELTLLGEIRLIVKRKEEFVKLQDQLYKHGFMEEALTLLGEIRIIVKKKEIKSQKQQTLLLCNSIKGEFALINSTRESIKESVEFLKKALPEIDNNQMNYKSELEHLASLL